MTMDVAAHPDDHVVHGLSVFTPAAQKRISLKLGLSLPGASQEATLASLAQMIGSPAHRQILERLLPAHEWSVLGLLPLRLHPIRIKSVLTALREGEWQGEAALESVNRLLSYGCLLPLGPPSSSQRLGIDVAADRHRWLQQWVQVAPCVHDWAKEHAPLRLAPTDPPSGIRGSALLDFQRVMFLTVAETGRQPIRTRADGLPYQADQRRLMKALARQVVARANGARIDSEPSAMVWLALSAAVTLGLVDEVSGSLRKSGGDADEFFRGPLEEQLPSLFAAWLQGRFNDFGAIPTLYGSYSHSCDPWLRSEQVSDSYSHDLTLERLAAAREIICGAIEEITAPDPDAWYSIEKLAGLIQRHAPDLLFDRVNDYEIFARSTPKNPSFRRPYTGVYRRIEGASIGAEARYLSLDTDWLEVEGAFVRQVVGETFRWLGVSETDEPSSDGEPQRFRLTTLGQHIMLGAPLLLDQTPVTSRVIVQPSFEVVVVDATNNWSLLAQLDVFAERRALDRAATFQLTQPALLRGLDQGWTGQRVIETLEAACGTPLPQNVRYSLEEWAALYEALTVHEAATLLEADTPAQLKRWLADPELASLLGRRLSATAVLVPARHRDLVVGRVLQGARGLRTIDYAKPPQAVLEARAPDLLEVTDGAADPYVRYCLGALGELLADSSENVVYRITPESVRRAAGEGWRAAAQLDFLKTAARGPLPPELVARLVGWSGQVPPLRAEALVAVQLPSDLLGWVELGRIRPIGRLIRALLTPTLALVSPADLDRLREELAERGLRLEEGPIAEIGVKAPQDPLSHAPGAWGLSQLVRSELGDGTRPMGGRT